MYIYRIMLKDIARLILDITLQPAVTWKKLDEEQVEQGVFMKKTLYPMFAIITLTAFLGVLFTRKEFDFELAIKSAILAFLTFFGGFFLSVYLLNEVAEKYFKLPKNSRLSVLFVGYSSLSMYAIYIILTLIPQFFFLRIFYLYTVYIVWEGVIPFMKIDESDQLKFTVASTVIVLLVPFLIDTILFFLMPGFRF